MDYKTRTRKMLHN